MIPSLRLCSEPGAKGRGQAPGKNTRGLRKCPSRKGLGAEEKIFPELALSSGRREGTMGSRPEGAQRRARGGVRAAKKTNPEIASPCRTRAYVRHFLFPRKKLS